MLFPSVQRQDSEVVPATEQRCYRICQERERVVRGKEPSRVTASGAGNAVGRQRQTSLVSPRLLNAGSLSKTWIVDFSQGVGSEFRTLYTEIQTGIQTTHPTPTHPYSVVLIRTF